MFDVRIRSVQKTLPLATETVRPSWRGRTRAGLTRSLREFNLIARDPTLALGLLVVGAFILLFVFYPLLRVIWQGFFAPETGAFSLKYFAQFVDPYYRGYQWQILRDTMVMGLLTATGGTLVGFLFAFTLVRCRPPFPRLLHVLALIPTISPPFAIAIAAILLFGRSGLITSNLLHIPSGQGINDLYGMDGLVFVQIITFFSVAYLILRGMLERIDPALEEAAQSLGASRLHILRTVTLPLLIPGIAGSFLLLFVESLADLGNPLLISGNTTVLSAEIFLAVNGQYDQQKGAALSLVLLIPTLLVFLVQRYWVSRRSYIAVTGKPTGGILSVQEPYLRYPFLIATALVVLLVLMLYVSIIVGSFTMLWGIDYTPALVNYQAAFTRGLAAIMATTFLSAVATPVAVVAGMIVAYLVVRRAFAGRETLDLGSNLGAAVPGTILGIGYIIAFIRPPLVVVALIFLGLAWFIASIAGSSPRTRWTIVAVAAALGSLLLWSLSGLPDGWWRLLMAGVFVLATPLMAWLAGQGHRKVALAPLGVGLYLLLSLYGPVATNGLAVIGRGLSNTILSRVVVNLASELEFFLLLPSGMLGFLVLTLAALATYQVEQPRRPWAAALLVALALAVTFRGEPLALVGSPYIVVAAFAVRSLPASVRAGVAALQQIDPAIEEASTSLGADAQTTFRQVTLPLIVPALLAGLIFSFARHMTSLSAIIFLTTPKWPILTVWILSEVEQGGLSTAAAYSVILIAIVLAAIGLMTLWTSRNLRDRPDVDLAIGGG